MVDATLEITHSTLEVRDVRLPGTDTQRENDMVYGERTLRSISSFDLHVPFVGARILLDLGWLG